MATPFFTSFSERERRPGDGAFTIELDGFKTSEQFYFRNTAILKTILHGESGSIEVTDFIPRFYTRNRPFRPQTLIRRISIKDGRRASVSG